MILAALMVLSICSCGTNPTNGNTSPSGQSTADKNKYPRYTGFDSYDQGVETIYALLENSHYKFKFNYYSNSQVSCQGLGECYYCLDRCYLNIDSNGAEASDTHYAIRIVGGRYYLYDFLHKIVVDDKEYASYDWANAWHPYGAPLMHTYVVKQSFLEDTSRGSVNRAESISGTKVCNIDCIGEQWMYHFDHYYLGNGDSADLLAYRIWVDPSTNIVMKGESYWDSKLQDGTVINPLQVDSEILLMERDCVTQKDIDNIIDSLYKGHESEYKTMDMAQYLELGYTL